MRIALGVVLVPVVFYLGFIIGTFALTMTGVQP